MSIFVDTGAWFASIVPADPHHRRIVEFLHRNSLPLITSDYVIDETLTLLRARGETTKRSFLVVNSSTCKSLTWHIFHREFLLKRGVSFAINLGAAGVSPIAPVRQSWTICT
jgi:predicted nucleic acid-binding protein